MRDSKYKNNTHSTKKYTISGLDCAQCAVNLEHEIRKIPGINTVNVNFLSKSIEFDASYEDEVKQVVKKTEPEAELYSKGNSVTKRPDRTDGAGEPAGRRHVLLRIETSIAVSIALFVIGFLTPALSYVFFGAAYILMGHKVVFSAVRNLFHGKVFDENFLMTIATIGAIVIGEIPEAVGVMLFYTIGEYFQSKAVEKSRRSISALLDLRPAFARRSTAEGPQEVAAEEIGVGERILVYAGEQIPLDGTVADGSSYVDTSALTGESVPKSIKPGDKVLGGYVNGAGTLTVTAEKPADESAVARVLHLVEDAAGRKAPTERFISRFARYYTPIVVVLAALVAFLPPVFLPGQTLAVWGYRALILLVISCPCALVVSVPLGYFGGVGAAAKSGLLVKGAEYLDRLLKTETIAVDKTGTITRGNFTVTDIVPRNGFSKTQLIKWAAAGESQSGHPVAGAIRSAASQQFSDLDIDASNHAVSEYREHKGYGVLCKVNGSDVVVGSDRLMHQQEIPHRDCDVQGTVVYVAVDGEYLGYILISDEIKAEAVETVQYLKELGVENIVMLTGDDQSAAAQVAVETGIDKYYSRLLPEDKLRRIEMLKNRAKERESVMFVGDGINDAPVLTAADVGVAMGGIGSDAAVEAADIVLMKDDLRTLPMGIKIARYTRKIVIQNIVGALGVKIAVLGLGIAGMASMWAAVFADVGVALLAVGNSLRVIAAFRGAAGREDATPSEPIPSSRSADYSRRR